MNARTLLLANLQSICLKVFCLLFSMTRHRIIPSNITNKVRRPMNKLLWNSKKMSPRGIKIKSARSTNGKNIFMHIKNLDFRFSFFEVMILVCLKVSIIPLAHLFLCLNSPLKVSGVSVKATAFLAKFV